MSLSAIAGIALATEAAFAQFISKTPGNKILPQTMSITLRSAARVHDDRRIEVDRYHDPRTDCQWESSELHRQRWTKTAAARTKSNSQINKRAQNESVHIPTSDERRLRPDEVIIELIGNPSTTQVDAIAYRHQLRRLESQFFALTSTTFVRLRVSGGALIAQRSLGRSLHSVLAGLGNDPNVMRAQPNFVTTLPQTQLASLPRGTRGIGDDPVQYAVRKLHLLSAHGLTRGENVLVAVIDSGIDFAHPALAGVIAATFDPLLSVEGPHTHGTAVAGLIGAQERLVGAAPGAQILAVRAFSTSGKRAESTTFAILKSLDWAVKNRARVINMSFAGPFDPAMNRALAQAHQKGIVLIAAAGNAGPKSPPLFPAANPNVIAVTASDIDDHLLPAANRGPYIAVAAPGVNLLAPSPSARYQIVTGTSFAAAEVSGIAALLIGRRPDVTPDVVRRILMTTAVDLGPKGRDSMYGAGLVDALRAIRAIEPRAERSRRGRP